MDSDCVFYTVKKRLKVFFLFHWSRCSDKALCITTLIHHKRTTFTVILWLPYGHWQWVFLFFFSSKVTCLRELALFSHSFPFQPPLWPRSGGAKCIRAWTERSVKSFPTWLDGPAALETKSKPPRWDMSAIEELLATGFAISAVLSVSFKIDFFLFLSFFSFSFFF